MIEAPVVFDLTGVIVAMVGGIFSILGIVATAVINSRMKDTKAAAVLGVAVVNSLGALQQASIAAVSDLHPQVRIAGVPDKLAVGVAYVLDHAGEEAARFGITPEAIADKINAQLGLQAMATSSTPLAVKLAALDTKPTAASDERLVPRR